MILSFLSPENIIEAFGLLGIFIVVFFESGVFAFFLPGDSLLFTAGFLASQGVFNVHVLFIGISIAAILGDTVGYSIGKMIGPKMKTWPDKFYFKQKYLIQAEIFYQKYGKKAIVLSRFVPVVRTFAPIAAGIANMKYRDFSVYNFIGGILWSSVFVYGGYFLGATVPGIEKYILEIIILIIIVSILPGVYHFFKK